MSVVQIISDTQAPFAHRDGLDFLVAVRDWCKPSKVVHIGDEVDFYAVSDYPKDPESPGFSEEMAGALTWMQDLYREFPEVMACESNHTARPLRKAFGSGLPSVFLRTYAEFLDAPKGWRWAEHWEIDDVRYEHGDAIFRGTGAPHTAAGRAAIKRGCSVVFGHLHSVAGISWIRNSTGRFFGMGVGCLIDESAYAFRYHKGPADVQLGCGVVSDGVPMWVPMRVDRRNRWVGKL